MIVKKLNSREIEKLCNGTPGSDVIFTTLCVKTIQKQDFAYSEALQWSMQWGVEHECGAGTMAAIRRCVKKAYNIRVDLNATNSFEIVRNHMNLPGLIMDSINDGKWYTRRQIQARIAKTTPYGVSREVVIKELNKLIKNGLIVRNAPAHNRAYYAAQAAILLHNS